jgi:hypothetical protein
MSKDPRRNEIKDRTFPFAPLGAQDIGGRATAQGVWILAPANRDGQAGVDGRT